MSSVECLRQFVNERLTAAAQEIFSVFEKTISDYEEEINRQRRLLTIAWKPEVKLHKTELPQDFINVEDIPTELQPGQDRKSILEKKDREQIPESHEEILTLPEEGEVELKEEVETLFQSITCDEDYNVILSNPVNEESTDTVSVKSVTECNTDDQLVSRYSQEVRKGQNEGNHSGSVITRRMETRLQRRHHRISEHSSIKFNTPIYTHKGKICEFVCEYCGKAFPYRSRLIRHQIIHTGVKPYCCHTCGKRFNQTSILKVHQRIHTGERPFSCDICGKRFNQKSILNVHKKIHSIERPFSCDFCGRRFKQKSKLESHVIWHSDIPQPLLLKEESFLSEQQLFNHDHHSALELGFTKVKEEQEDNCLAQKEQLVFKQETDMFMITVPHDEGHDHSVAQTLNRNSEEEETVEIISDDKSGKQLEKTHPRICNVYNPILFKTSCNSFVDRKCEYKCNTCGKVFQFKSRLIRHFRIHTGVRPFSCHICGKRFNQKSILQVHQRIHTGERPFSCDICGKRFNQKSILNVHKRIHTGERPYSCQVCGKRFNQKSILDGHVRTHTGERPYSCKTCGKSFKSQSSLLVHMKMHADKKTYSCEMWERLQSYVFMSVLTMYPVQSMRKFVCDRLTAAAQEILGAFEKRVEDYEAELARQRRMLDMAFSPEMKLQRAEMKALLNQQQHGNNYDVSRFLPDTVQIKDEHEEISISQERPQPLQHRQRQQPLQDQERQQPLQHPQRQQPLQDQEQQQPLQHQEQLQHQGRLQPLQHPQRPQPLQHQEQLQPFLMRVLHQERPQLFQQQERPQLFQQQERPQPLQQQERLQPLQQQERPQPLQQQERLQPLQQQERPQPLQQQERLQPLQQQEHPQPLQQQARPQPFQQQERPQPFQQQARPQPFQQQERPQPFQQQARPQPFQQQERSHPLQQQERPHPLQQQERSQPLQQQERSQPLQQQERPHPFQQQARSHPLQQQARPHPLQQQERPHPLQQQERPHPLQQQARPHPLQQQERPHPLQQQERPHPLQQQEHPHPSQQLEQSQLSQLQEVPVSTLTPTPCPNTTSGQSQPSGPEKESGANTNLTSKSLNSVIESGWKEGTPSVSEQHLSQTSGGAGIQHDNTGALPTDPAAPTSAERTPVIATNSEEAFDDAFYEDILNEIDDNTFALSSMSPEQSLNMSFDDLNETSTSITEQTQLGKDHVGSSVLIGSTDLTQNCNTEFTTLALSNGATPTRMCTGYNNSSTPGRNCEASNSQDKDKILTRSIEPTQPEVNQGWRPESSILTVLTPINEYHKETRATTEMAKDQGRRAFSTSNQDKSTTLANSAELTPSEKIREGVTAMENVDQTSQHENRDMSALAAKSTEQTSSQGDIKESVTSTDRAESTSKKKHKEDHGSTHPASKTKSKNGRTPTSKRLLKKPRQESAKSTTDKTLSEKTAADQHTDCNIKPQEEEETSNLISNYGQNDEHGGSKASSTGDVEMIQSDHGQKTDIVPSKTLSDRKKAAQHSKSKDKSINQNKEVTKVGKPHNEDTQSMEATSTKRVRDGQGSESPQKRMARDEGSSSTRSKEVKKYDTRSKESTTSNQDPDPPLSNTDDSESSEGEEKVENPYKCDRCGKVMSNFKNYKFHMKTHTVAKTYKCDTCGKMFRESWDLNKHLVIHSAEKPYKCDVCGNGFNRRYNLDLHLRVHTGEKPYICNTCGKTFSSCVNMKKHMRIHTGEKPYTCKECGKEFADSSAFKNHLRVHTGEKPFKCSYCKKKFATRTTLKRHIRTHTGEKPYKCTVCDRNFGHRTDLKGHMRMHTGEKPYKCTTCGEDFSTWSKLNKHKRIHSGEAQDSTE
ncbi:uncharacterized protein LOC129366023 [Poeciliopsis prolifica]|uniref:uncharacterized protein LOC129366023 n=1 Tax=Poeciliopsis prolifica TaxID=188132 RepID=UPI0024137130|nr:uncharacterized protein LOC129366023 [Poeciliopsis prolifica]